MPYPKNYRRTLFVSNVNPKKETTSEGTSLEGTNTGETTIILDMNQHDYYEENNTDYESGWWNQGAGLFTNFSYTAGCIVQNLTIQDCVRVKLYSPFSGDFTKARKKDFDICVGGFAGHVFNSQGVLSFSNVHLKDLNVYGGTSTGGVIGQVDKLGGNENKTLKFENWSIENLEVIKEVEHDGSTGGLIGWVRNANVIIEGDKEKDCVDVLTVKTMADEQKYATAAGLIGALDGGTTEIKNVNIKNLTVEGGRNRDTGGLVAGVRENGSITIENCILDTIDIKSRNSINLGGVLGFHNQSTTITGITIKGASSVSGNSCNRTGGVIGRSETKVTLSGCHLEGTENAPINVLNNNVTGGFIGSSTSINSITNGEETYVNIVSASNTNAGGLVGHMDNGSANASNIAFSNVTVVTKSSGNYTGLLTGNNNSKIFNGYNILASGCNSGYDSNASVDNIGSLSITSGTKNGLWVGNATGTIKLVAVGVDGTNSPQKDVGEGSGTVSITYADYPPVDITNWKDNASAYPYVDVNPKVDLVTKASADATESSVLSITGNGVGFLGEGAEGKTIAQVIAEKSNSSATNKVYQNAVDISSMVLNSSQPSSNSAYISSYQEEEGTQGAGNFAMLVINAAESDPNSRIWKYIAALTNVDSVYTAQSQVMVGGVTATTYKWENNGFVMQTPSTLSVTDNNISINMDGNKPRDDSGKNQFTLLDVKYDDPTDSGSKSFHLYIPVYVQKVLETKFSIQFLAGTDYCSEHYQNIRKTYATAGFNEPVTCYITYSYQRNKEDWEDALKSGENVLGYYEKILDLEANTSSQVLPIGTRLTLVDKQTGQCYNHVLDSDDNVHRFNLSQMESGGVGVSFTPQPIYTLLEMSAEKATDGKFVITTDESTATVKVGDIFYRPADGEEGSKYNITVSNAKPEAYYLTIQIPKTISGSSVSGDVDVSNSTLASSRSDAVDAKIIDRRTNGKYVLYDGITQTTEISTKHVVGEAEKDDTLMTDNEGIEITLTSTLRLTPDGQTNFRDLGPDEVHHQFAVNMKKDLKGILSDTVIGTSNASYTYTVKQGEDVICEYPGSFSDSNLAENLTISYGSSDLRDALLSEEVIITAVITLTYPTVEYYFPLHGKNDNVSGIMVCADSKVSNVASHLPITSTKDIVNDSKRYYTEKISTSTPRLRYFTVNRSGNGNGDITQQLGINPSDKVENSIHTEAEYDYSDVDEEALERAASLKYTMELFRKNNEGNYNETSPLVIGDYLKNISINGRNISQTQNQKYEWTDDNFRLKDTQKIDFSPLTGSEFENNGYIYANYKVKLTAVLLDAESKEIDGTKASDYIIYTNARIYQQMINLSN